MFRHNLHLKLIQFEALKTDKYTLKILGLDTMKLVLSESYINQASEEDCACFEFALQIGLCVMLRGNLNIEEKEMKRFHAYREEAKQTLKSLKIRSVSYEPIRATIHTHLPIPGPVEVVLRYLHTSYAGFSWEEYAQASFDHMEIDFSHAMGGGTLSLEYKGLFLREWDLAERQSLRIRSGFISKSAFLRFHQRMQIVHKIQSWELDDELLRYIDAVFSGELISLRDLCLYAEEGEEYVRGTENSKRLERKKGEESSCSYRVEGMNPCAYKDETFQAYADRCLNHMRVDYEACVNLHASRTDSRKSYLKSKFLHLSKTLLKLWREHDKMDTGYLRSRSQALCLLQDLGDKNSPLEYAYIQALKLRIKKMVARSQQNKKPNGMDPEEVNQELLVGKQSWFLSLRRFCLALFAHPQVNLDTHMYTH
ncbi:hypothetical protein AAMO2058_000264500 [Amorphochlora amoebiformis]